MSSHKGKEQKSNCKIPILLNTCIQVQQKFQLSNSRNQQKTAGRLATRTLPPSNKYAANWIITIK